MIDKYYNLKIYSKIPISGNCAILEALVSGNKYSVTDDKVSFSSSYNSEHEVFRLHDTKNK